MGRLRSAPGRIGAAPERLGRAAAGADRAAQNQAADRWRGSARARGYGARWAKASKRHQAEHPVCDYCRIGAFGPVRVAAVELTDHLYPARDWPQLFWVEANWVSACRACHDGPKQALEARGDQALLDDLARRLGRTPFAT